MAPTEKPPSGRLLKSPLPDSNRRPPLYHLRQVVAAHGNGFCVSEPFWRVLHLSPIAIGCNRWLRKCSILRCPL